MKNYIYIYIYIYIIDGVLSRGMEKKVIPTCDPTILKVHTWIYIYLYIIDGVLFDRYGKKIVFIVFSSIGMEKMSLDPTILKVPMWMIIWWEVYIHDFFLLEKRKT